MDSIELNNYYVNIIESGDPHSLRILCEMEAARSPSERRHIDRVRNELMFSLNNFSEKLLTCSRKTAAVFLNEAHPVGVAVIFYFGCFLVNNLYQERPYGSYSSCICNF